MTVPGAEPAGGDAEDVLDPVLAELDDIAGALERAIGYGGSPEDLEIRAARLQKIAGRLAALPARLHEDIGLSVAEAAARRAADEAAEAVTGAEGAVTAALAVYEAAAEPERVAAARATEARQACERATDEAGQARARGASPDVLIDADMRVTSAEWVAEHEAAKLAGARERRQAARAALDKARDRARQAAGALEAARAAAAEPAAGDLDTVTLLRIWELSWTYRLDGVLNGTMPKLTDDEYRVIRFLATNTCEEQAWMPASAVDHGRKLEGARIAAAAREGRGVTIQDRKGMVTLGRIRPGDRVIAPASVAGTFSQGR